MSEFVENFLQCTMFETCILNFSFSSIKYRQKLSEF